MTTSTLFPSLPGTHRKPAFDDAFLLKHGAAPGSTIAMTKTGYMTEEAWDELAPPIADGIRKMPVICEMPDWWVLNIVDGFGPHVSSLKAMEIYAERKILLLKEEGDASHVTQAYDRESQPISPPLPTTASTLPPSPHCRLRAFLTLTLTGAHPSTPPLPSPPSPSSLSPPSCSPIPSPPLPCVRRGGCQGGQAQYARHAFLPAHNLHHH